MRLDVDLVKLLLIKTEGEQAVDLSSYTEDQIRYHQKQIYLAGWAEGGYLSGNDGISAAILTALTPKGHQHLAAMRENTSWRKIRDLALKAGAGLTMAGLQEIITRAVAQFFR